MLTGVNVVINKTFQVWDRIWFQDKNTVPLEVVRMGIGFLLFFNYILLAPNDVIAFYGESGLLSRDVVPEINSITSFSFFRYFDEPWQLLVFHYVFVSLCFLFFIGWKTKWIKWLVLIGHLSYFNRNEFALYGVDGVMIALLLLLCIAPIGSALSMDRIRQVRQHKDKFGLNARPPLATSYRAFACQRLIQIQMAVIYFSAGISKLHGESWWHGDAPWFAMINNETAFFPVDFLAQHYWIINLMAYGTILIEVAYPFLIWGRTTRPYLLTAALFIHVSIAILLGMYYFSAAMAFGHLAFMRREWYSAAGQWWRQKFSGMEMIYDGDCGFCKRSMALFLAFDGLNQIKTRNYHTDPSSIISNDDLDRALYTVVENKTAYSGFDAYRYVVLRTPGTWWFAPLYYIPGLSRLVGRPIYRWIAQNRMELSKWIFTPKKSKIAKPSVQPE